MKTYRIPVVWSCAGTISVDAESIEDAIEQAEESSLPNNGEYIYGSFEVDMHHPLIDQWYSDSDMAPTDAAILKLGDKKISLMK